MADVCQLHSGFSVEIEHLKTEVAKIPSLEEAVQKLTYIVETMNNKTTRQDSEDDSPRDYAFWDTKAGQMIPICATILIGMVIAALVGTNLIEGWQAIQAHVPMPN
jgi:hypothetical protein